jgi:hypothetical protein
MSDSCSVCHSPFTCALSRTSHFALYPSHEHGHACTVDKAEEASLVENLKGKYRRRKEATET